MNSKNVVIVGGRGGMGSLCAYHLAAVGHLVTPIGRADWDENKHKLTTADLVIISVPIDATPETITRVAPVLGPQTILSDLTSIKEGPLEHMMSAHPGPVLGLHPVFGPSVTDPTNQVIVHCPGRDNDASAWVIDSFSQAGFTMVGMSGSEHDEYMTIIQALKHFSTYCLGSFLHKKGINLDMTRKVASPIYRLEMDMMGRIFSQSPDLYADIIMANSKRLQVVREFVDHIDEACAGVEHRQRDEFIQKFSAAAEWMGDFTRTAMEESDRVIKVIDGKRE